MASAGSGAVVGKTIRGVAMKRHRLWAAVAIAFAITEACGSKTPPSGNPTGPSGVTPVGSTPSGAYTMSGFVRRADFARTPLENASVQILDGPRASAVATTDAAGAYHVPDVPAGKIQVWASKTGYEGDPGDREDLSGEGT